MKPEMESAVQTSIEMERKAYRLYVSMMKSAPNSNTESLFRNLAMQEMKHETLLMEFRETGNLFAAKDKVTSMYDGTFEISDKISPSVEMKGFREGFLLAIEKEKAAQAAYNRLKEEATDEDLKELFNMLLREEEEHAMLLRQEYKKVYP